MFNIRDLWSCDRLRSSGGDHSVSRPLIRKHGSLAERYSVHRYDRFLGYFRCNRSISNTQRTKPRVRRPFTLFPSIWSTFNYCKRSSVFKSIRIVDSVRPAEPVFVTGGIRSEHLFCPVMITKPNLSND